ncbi:MCE family protein [Mycobacterium sp. 236(2023)]|uniref:MCE family protein n=1 Tax=Mycobacterium sp. 236(2023) TaxID=3038163 RepID=UPI002414D490|nr:MCE family protein [Mycobacterium sp. 236(2023)]MDG4668135.1 MCE family protein [Mycobacterium sp. 236(2023)]
MSTFTVRRTVRAAIATLLVAVIAGASWQLMRHIDTQQRNYVTAYFDNSKGIFAGDDVRIRGVNVGKIDTIEPQGTRVKISFWFDAHYPVPADAKAVILSPTLVTSRAIQLTPPYHGGATMTTGAAIPQARTAVPVEFDDFRVQLEKLTAALQPTEPGNVSTLGALVNTAADNLRGQGPAIRKSIIELSQALSALGDNTGDVFASVKNLAALVSALQGSTDIIRALNTNLASVSSELSDSPDETGKAVEALSEAANDVSSFVADNRESLGVTSDKLTSLSQALNDSIGDIKQLLHIGPTTLENSNNTYFPAQGTVSGVLAANNFNNPITFLCGAIQAASRLNAEQSSKLCVQYLAPIIKNRQYNFPPLGMNPIVGATARPNEVTYSEDWMRPDYIPPQPPVAEASPQNGDLTPGALPAEAPLHTTPHPQPTDPSAGLPGMMLPPQGPPR